MKDNLDINSIVRIETMPKIFYQLELIGKEVDKSLKDLDKLVCTEENKQEVKKRKQEITAFKNAMEDKRKDIKKLILQDYEVFNNKYELEVKNKLINAENTLKNKYLEIENEQKLEKENKLREFASEYFISNNIQNIVKFEDIGLNITLNASEKSLKEQIVAFCKRIANDVDTILLEDMKEEISVEYKQCLNYAEAKKRVLERKKELEKAKEITSNIEDVTKINEAIVKNVKEIVSTNIENINVEVIEEVTFTVATTKEKLIKLKHFLEEENIDWR